MIKVNKKSLTKQQSANLEAWIKEVMIIKKYKRVTAIVFVAQQLNIAYSTVYIALNRKQLSEQIIDKIIKAL